MSRWPKRALVGAVLVAFLGASLTVVDVGPAATTSTVPVQRIYGTDAIGTSIAVGQAEFPSAGSARAVVLARSDFFADALAGGPLRLARRSAPHYPGASLSATLDPRRRPRSNGCCRSETPWTSWGATWH